MVQSQQLCESQKEAITRDELKEMMKQQLQELLEIQNAQKEDNKSNLLKHFRKEIEKLKVSLADRNEENILRLEHKKNIWNKQMTNIRNIYHDLAISHNVEEDIDEELELINSQYEEGLNNIFTKMTVLKEDKRTLVLEAIKIPIFNGQMEQWPSFKYMFEQFVDKSKLSGVEKFIKLKIHLESSALNAIRHLPITENNYEAAWNILNEKFNNRGILFKTLVDNILNCNLGSSQSTNDMRSKLNIINENIQALKAIDVPIEDADPIIARILLKKLSVEWQSLYEQRIQNSDDIQKITDVMNFMELKYEALINMKNLGWKQ